MEAGVTSFSYGRALHRFVQSQKNAVPYVRQMRSWDCGLACVAMALKALGFKQVSLEDLIKRCSVEATWTIDIAYLLHEHGVSCLYYTVIRGVRPEYLSHAFYKEMHDSRDTNRVLERFNDAETFGVTVIEGNVNIADIQRAIVEQGQLVLVLVDKRLLRCTFCDGNQPSRESFRMTQRNSNGFLGHFVLLYAYHEDSGYFLVKDPASGRDHCVVSASTLDHSRLAFGTDEDIIFIGNTSSSASQFTPSQNRNMQQELSQNEIAVSSQASTFEDDRLVLMSDSSPSSTVGRDIFNFVLRKVFGVSIPRTK